MESVSRTEVVDGSVEKSRENLRISSQDRAVDMLVAQRFITKKPLEMALREVLKFSHPEEFFTDIVRNFASLQYLRTSEPCINMHLLDKLKLGPGMSFLCIACDTGFMNAVAGLIIGPYGVNHGICLKSNNVHYARKFVDSFGSCSEVVSQFGICVPEIRTLNALTMERNTYDRLFCERAAPVSDLLWLLKPGGRAVIVHKNSWRVATRNVMPHVTCKLIRRVNVIDMSDLQKPINTDYQPKLPVISPTSLLNSCRAVLQKDLTRRIMWPYVMPERRPSLVECIEAFRNVPYLRDLVLKKVAKEVAGMERPVGDVGTWYEKEKIKEYERDVKLYLERQRDGIPFSHRMREMINDIPMPPPLKNFLSYRMMRRDTFND